MQHTVVKAIDVAKYSIQNYLSSNLGLELSDRISLPSVIKRRCIYNPNSVALREKVNGAWVSTTYAQFLDMILTYAAQLINFGLQKGDRIAVFLPNCKAWAISDLGNLYLGGVTVPIYETLNDESIKHILKNSGSKIIIVKKAAQADKIRAMQPDLPELEHIVVLDSDSPFGIGWSQWMGQGALYLEENREMVEAKILDIKRDDLATIIYTSGTTGLPKGVMLTHKNILSNLYGISMIANINDSDEMLSILPLSHIFERVVGHFAPLMMGASISYAESIEKVSENLQEIRPTVCAAVPRIFEKIYAAITAQVAAGSPVKQKLFAWARRVGDKNTQMKEQTFNSQQIKRSRHRPEEFFEPIEYVKTSLWSRFQFWLAGKLVFSKIDKKFGGRIKYFLTGGAALSPEIISFFRSVNIKIFEGYGLTETSPIVAFNFGSNYEEGTVGKLLPFVQVKFGEDGEILVKGPNVMKGYFRMDEATKEAITEDGWFHTGDLGTITTKNHLKITGRKKDLLVTSNGKNVASTPIEVALNSSDLVACSLVVGDGRKYISALIFPDFVALDQLAASLSISGTTEDLCRNSTVIKEIQKLVDQVNKSLSRYEQIKTFSIVPEELSVENGFLTPTMKLKRNIVAKKFSEEVEKLYEQAG